jgi:hypothetical protein
LESNECVEPNVLSQEQTSSAVVWNVFRVRRPALA